MTKKPIVAYVHRYPIEEEAHIFTAVRQFLNLLSKDYEIIYISYKNPKGENKELRKGIKHIELPLSVDVSNSRDKWMKMIIYYLFLPYIIWKIKREKVDVIMCKEFVPFFPSILARLGKPVFLDHADWWLTSFFGKNRLTKRITNKIESMQIKDLTKKKVFIVTHSKFEANYIASLGFPKDRIRVINYSLYKGVYGPVNASKEREKLGIKKNDKVAAVHGIIHPSKGYEQLLVWWKRIVKEHPEWKLLIIGGASGEKWCANRIEELGIKNNVIMTGWLPSQKDVNRYLNAADCLLVTRKNSRENYGLTPSSLFHGLAVGKPTLATGLPAMAEVIKDGYNGYLFEPDSYDSFRNKLKEIYGNSKKSANVAKMGIKRGAEYFDLDSSAEKYAKVTRDIEKYFTSG